MEGSLSPEDKKVRWLQDINESGDQPSERLNTICEGIAEEVAYEEQTASRLGLGEDDTMVKKMLNFEEEDEDSRSSTVPSE